MSVRHSKNNLNTYIYIPSDSRAAIKVFDNQFLFELVRRSIDQPIWMFVHEGTASNESADQLAKLESECPLMGQGSACGISASVAKKVIRDWTKTVTIRNSRNP
jgi:hypothetical protein